MKKQKFVTTMLCILLVSYVTSVFTPPSFASITPNVSVCKKFLDTSDPGPYEMRTLYHWDIEIRASTNVPLTETNVYDRFGGELKIDHITIPSIKTYTFTYPKYEEKYPTAAATVIITDSTGWSLTHELDSTGVTFGKVPYKFMISWSGMTHKVNFQWVIGNLAPDPGSIRVIVGVSTDLNPGGKQEFTSPCEHILNSGAVLKARWGRLLISAYSGSLWVKVACPGRLLIDKFNDINGNGQPDFGEPKIPGWRVDVTDPYGVVTTYYTPVDLEINDYGAYIITEEIRADWTQTAVLVDGVPQTVNPTVIVTVNVGETHEVLYGNKYSPRPGRLLIEKFNDKDGNGVFDGSDVWITGWEVDVKDPSGDVSTLSTPVGLSITEFGAYSITEHLPTYWVQTALIVDGVTKPVNPTATVPVNSGESHEVVYGNWLPPGELIIKKFNDKNNNGVFDAGDEWITSWSIDVTDPSGDKTTYTTVPIDLIITEFGTYTIKESLPAGWVQTALIVDTVAQPVDPTVTVTVDPGETHEVIYGNYKPPLIGISLYINPIWLPVGSSIAFTWTTTSPPEVTPVSVVLRLVPPSGPSLDIYTGTTFPDDFAKTITWTATTPRGTWWAYVIYTYTYLGVTRTAVAFSSFNVY